MILSISYFLCVLCAFYDEGRSVKSAIMVFPRFLTLPSCANRERLAGGPGGGNERPWSAHGGAETPAWRPACRRYCPSSLAPSLSVRFNLLWRVTSPFSSRRPDDFLESVATCSSGFWSRPK